MTEQEQQAFERRVQQSLDGTLPRNEFLALQEQLKADPSARSIYYELAALHQSLQFRLSRTSASINSVASELVEARLHRQKKRALTVTAIAAAALITLTLIALKITSIKYAPETVAQLRFETSPGSTYVIDAPNDSTPSDGEFLRVNSRFRLSQGTVKLTLSTGVEAIVQAPADLMLKSDELLYLNEGAGSFTVPTNAVGFTVKTKELNIVDLGTKFGVISDPLKGDEIHVFKGKVRASALSGVKGAQELVKGQATRVLPNGRLESTQLSPDRFFYQLPKSLPHQHWSFDRVENFVESDTTLKKTALSYRLHKSPKSTRITPLSEGKFSTCLSLDGEANYIETNWDGILRNKPRSVAFWLKLPNRRNSESNPHRTLGVISWGEQQDYDASRISNNSKWTVHLDYDNHGKPIFNTSFGGFWYFSPDLELDDDLWHHIAVSYSGKCDESGRPITDFYLDGVLTSLSPAAHHPVRRDTNGDIIIDTNKAVPMHMGTYFDRETIDGVVEGKTLKGELDELFIIEGGIDQETVLRLLNENRLTE